MKKLFAGCALAALATSSAYAQSTGSDTIESNEIVVTGTRTAGLAGAIIPDVPKTRSIINQSVISRSTAGQSVLQVINQIPGVNYTNSDPYGSSGGNLRIRGFPGNRIAFLWDGLPLNDTGNYSIYGNQTIDAELIDQISVNLGTTDVDSPTPSAAGGVVAYRTIMPTEDFGVVLMGSYGTFDYGRGSVLLNTGSLTKGGLRAFFQASEQQYEKFRGPGRLHKTQYNFRVYQPLGANGDFVSLAGHYNRNRNNSYNSGLSSDYAANRFFDNIDTCVRDTPNFGGTPDNDGSGSSTNNSTPASCTNYYGLRINPSNTGNLRGSARLTLTDKLVLTVDPGYQYTLANGGGTTTIAEGDLRLRGGAATGGVDLNNDGDVIDTGIRVYQPSNTRTNRYTALASLVYELNDTNRVRLAYTFDRGEHRQTGEFGRVTANGDTIDVFGGKYNTAARIVSLNGKVFQNRDRYSIAMLNQISGEYFGKFMDERLTLTAGLRAPFFKRELDQRCYTQVAINAVYCGVQPAGSTIVAPTFSANGAAVPTTFYYAPFERNIKYSPLLPSAGISFKLASAHSIYGSYGRNFSAPSTDNLYRSAQSNPKGETTDAFELGYRYRGRLVQAQVSAFWTQYKNRIVSATDADPASPTFGTSIDRNVGSARVRGIDGQVAFQPVKPLILSVFGGYTDSEIKDNVLNSAGAVVAYTGGKEFVETPKWQYGARGEVNFDPLSFSVSWKHVGKRWSTDDNGTGANGAAVGTITAIGGVVASNGLTNSYDTVDGNIRISLERYGLAKTQFDLSVINLFDKYYFGNITTAGTLGGGPRYSVGSPRTIQLTMRIGF
jgi:iron complex outermembrane receptor protein